MLERKRPKEYIDFLRWRDKTLGIAHTTTVIGRKLFRSFLRQILAIIQGDWWSNCRSIGYEVCESLSANDQDFIQNEDVALMESHS